MLGGTKSLHRHTNRHTNTHTHTHTGCPFYKSFFSLVSFLKKRKDLSNGQPVCVCVCLCVCVCVCVCVCLYVCVSVYNFGPPPINFKTSYPIDTKFWLHTVSYRNSRTPLIPFLTFENCAWEKFLKFIFSPFN